MAERYSGLYNPDVLDCLANLSNDEVFTPPSVANAMLDLLPPELWRNSKAKFLDPACKSGVFLREIAKRLIEGLADEFPDLQERLNHIFHEQLYGLAITELTSLLSRRSLYCSKYPSSKYSISKFSDPGGNIRFKRVEHTWKDGKCIFCGAAEREYQRSGELETYAYEFIHLLKPEEVFGMKFDVVISNPPYQLNTAGDKNGAQARPLYHHFVERAIKLNSRYVIMITPSRWFAGGWGLDNFRKMMITCNHIEEIHDYPIASDCFPGIPIPGGVSFFKYVRDYDGPCKFFAHDSSGITSQSTRFLKETHSDVLIRLNGMVSIVKKATAADSFLPFSSLVSPRSPFGFNTNHHGHIKQQQGDVAYYERQGVTYMKRSEIKRGIECIDKWKIFISKAYGAGEGYPHQIINKPIPGLPGMICSGTFLSIGPFETECEMTNAITYMNTKFFRALVAANKVSQDASYKVYAAVPVQDFSKSWTDEELYAKYGLTDEEIAFIESMIKPMESGGETDG